MEEAEPNGNGTGQIYGLMTKILSEVEAIGKGRRNQEQNYAFRGIDDVYNMIHPLFAKYGVFTLPRVLNEESAERPTRSGGIMRFSKLTMAYDFYAADGSHVTVETVGEAMDPADKASNKAMSAAHKYGLLQTFCIPTSSTPDADYHTPEEIVGEPQPTSKNSTSAQKCPDCGGAMWDNRETKKGNQPDFKCKDRGCNKAVWLPKEDEAHTNGYGPDQALRDQLFSQAEKLMGGMEPAKRKEALGRLLMLPTDEMGKRVSELAENARRKTGTAPGHSPGDGRELKIGDIKRDADTTQLERYLATHYSGKSLEQLAAADIDAVHNEFVVPF